MTHLALDDSGRIRESRLQVAHREMSKVILVPRHGVMHKLGPWGHRILERAHSGEWVVFDLDPLDRVLRLIAAAGSDGRNAFSHVPQPVPGEHWPLGHYYPGRCQVHPHRFARTFEVGGAEGRDDARRPTSAPKIDALEVCVSERTAQECDVQVAFWLEVVDEACRPAQQRAVLQAGHARAYRSVSAGRHPPSNRCNLDSPNN